jgi:hypothetical protein
MGFDREFGEYDEPDDDDEQEIRREWAHQRWLDRACNECIGTNRNHVGSCPNDNGEEENK